MFHAQHLARSSFPIDRRPKRNDGGAREIQLGEAPFDASRVARFLRAPDGALRVALVNTATGAEFGSLPLAERSQAELARVMAIVTAMRERLAARPALPVASAPVVVTPAAPAANGWNVAAPGDRVRWEPTPRIAAKGVAPVEGVLAAAIRTASTTRFAKIDLGGKPVQVWENQGTLHVLGGEARELAPVAVVEAAPRAPREAALPRAPKPPPSPLDAAGLATPKRVTPAAAWKGPPESIKALQAVETVMPLLSGRAVFGPARRLVAEFRAWIETGEDPRNKEMTDRETGDKAMREEADFVQENALSAVNWLRHNGFGGRADHAYDIARRLAATLRFDAAGGNYAERMAKVTGEPLYLKWYGDNPHFGLPLTPSPQEAIERVTRMVAESSEGWTIVAPEQRGRSHGSGGSTNLARDWESITGGFAPVLLKRHAGEVLSAKGYLLDAITRAERTGRPPEREFRNAVNNVSRALEEYETVLLLDAAFRAGLRSPADAARPALQAKADAIVATQDAITARLAPRVEALVHRAGAELAALAVTASEAFEAARARDKTLRVPQTADVAQLMRKSLEEYAAAFMNGEVLVRSLSSLEWIAGENWTRSLRPGGHPLIPSTDAAYVGPALRTIRDVAERPAAWIAIRAMQAIGYPDAEALSKADRLREHYSRGGDRATGPWEPMFREPYSHNIQARWKEFSEPSSRPRSLWGRGGEE